MASKLAPEQLFSVQTVERFAGYVSDNFFNVGRDERGWFTTRDAVWTMKTMREDGFNVSLRGGDSVLQADDSIRTYFDLTV